MTENDFNTQTQPIVATNVGGHAAMIFVGGGSGTEYAYDALSGQQVWTQAFGQETFSCGGGTAYFGIGGTTAYDAATQAIYVASGSGSASTSTDIKLYKLSPTSGSTLGSTDITPTNLSGESNFAHTAVTLGPNGRVYVGTSSTCDIPSWRGRIAAVNDSSMTLQNEFFTTYGQGGNYGGGGVWGWGGATLDGSGNVYIGVGNADTSGMPPSPAFTATSDEQQGYGENLVELSNDASTVEANNFPNFSFTGMESADLDLVGSPVVFQPLGCATPLVAIQGKSGGVYFYNSAAISSGPIASYQFGESSYNAGYAGNIGFSPITQLAYVDVSASQSEGSLYPPGLVSISFPNCVPTIANTAQFGVDSYTLSYTQPRSAPTVTAGGLVFVSSPNPDGIRGDVFALDATTLSVLNNGTPIFTMPSIVRMAPVVDGNWLFVEDNAGDLARWTFDPAYQASASAKLRARERKRSRSLSWEPPERLRRTRLRGR